MLCIFMFPCAFTAGQSSAEAQTFAGASGRVGQHVPLQRRGRKAGALNGGCVYGHGGSGELRAQVQSETVTPNIMLLSLTVSDDGWPLN